MSMEKVTLGELYTVHNGLSKGRKFFGSGYPFLSFSTVFNNYFIPNELVDLVQSDEKEQKIYSISRGDVFVTRTSETSDELGMSCVALKDYPRATYNGFTKRMRPIATDRVHPEYIGYYMRMPSFRGEFQAFSTMTTRASLRNEDLLSLTILLPPMEQQIKIAEVLQTYDKLIENNQKQIKLLEDAAQRLYKEWFVDLRFPGYEDVKVVDGVPEGWRYKRVEEFGEVITGKTPLTSKTEYYGGNIPFVTIPDMHGNVFPLVTEKTLTKVGADTQKNKYLPVNSVIVSCIATVGLVNIAVEACQTNQQINSVILQNDNELYFFYESMKRIKALLDGVGSNGATMTNVNKTKFSSIKVLYPVEDLVKRYNEFCKPIFDKILALSKSIIKAEQARDRLLPKLMSGEIKV